ncbi:Zinc finger protein 42-like [Hondaea fermentalgiana]|uniref:Zinc finger protein 42-like n=1 Tax=Hondaea fermentalgiana TaxID=2315210 RepID=A0A2R5GDD5_9STRA|nr:Zinc finger protein 42-like [Hondaea fermentalgiana]|eukprot:GBG28980.1 Zinc finger protein 42-like [Hondaea fermentalgiana]
MAMSANTVPGESVAAVLRQLALSSSNQHQHQHALPDRQAHQFQHTTTTTTTTPPPPPPLPAVLSQPELASRGFEVDPVAAHAAAQARSHQVREQLAEMHRQTIALSNAEPAHSKLVEEAFRQHELQVYLEESQAGAVIAKARADPRPFKCTFPNCTKSFKEKKVLRKHLLTHQPKRFHCAYPGCHKSFYERAKLKRHNLVHTGEKNFVCTFEGCNKRFALKANLQTHFRVHSGDRPYPCLFKGCNKRFTQTSGRNSHYKTHLHQRKRKLSESSDATEPNHDMPPSPALLSTNENRASSNTSYQHGRALDAASAAAAAAPHQTHKLHRSSTADFALQRHLSAPEMQRTHSVQSVASSISNPHSSLLSPQSAPASPATNADLFSHVASGNTTFHPGTSGRSFLQKFSSGMANSGRSTSAPRLCSPMQADATPPLFPLQPGNEAPSAALRTGTASYESIYPGDRSLEQILLRANAFRALKPANLTPERTSFLLSVMQDAKPSTPWDQMLQSMLPAADKISTNCY